MRVKIPPSVRSAVTRRVYKGPVLLSVQRLGARTVATLTVSVLLLRLRNVTT